MPIHRLPQLAATRSWFGGGVLRVRTGEARGLIIEQTDEAEINAENSYGIFG
jgi:hypothetical protein